MEISAEAITLKATPLLSDTWTLPESPSSLPRRGSHGTSQGLVQSMQPVVEGVQQ